MEPIKPIEKARQKLVMQRTVDYIHHAKEIFNTDFPGIPVRFDLKGKAAGMYRVRNAEREIRYNPYIFAKYFDDNLGVTVPHEVAHYITDMVFGLSHIRPHGEQWKELMFKFGANASRTCNYDMDGIPRRIHQRYAYRCDCMSHQLTARRRNQIRQGIKRYFCRKCNSLLVPGL